MKLFVAGDICPTDVTRGGFAAADVENLFGSVTRLVSGADGFLVNLECAVTESGRALRKMGPNLKAPVRTAETLKNLGVTLVGLSNNHVFDFGEEGLNDTKRYLREAGLPFTGIGDNEQDARKPFYFTAGGVKCGVICVCEHEYSYALPNRQGAWGFDPFETMEDVAEARKNAEYVLVLYHGGKEQCEVPSPRLRKAARALIRAGADAVICQHSHCIGCRESYLGGEIVYGEGNFNFCAHDDNPQWHSGLICEIGGKPGNWTYTYSPVVQTNTGITLAEGEEKETLLRGFADWSDALADGRWLKRWNEFCEEQRAYYTAAVTGDPDSIPFKDIREEQLAEFFPHFLDCEAHSDVWKELFPTWHGAAVDDLG